VLGPQCPRHRCPDDLSPVHRSLSVDAEYGLPLTDNGLDGTGTFPTKQLSILNADDVGPGCLLPVFRTERRLTDATAPVLDITEVNRLEPVADECGSRRKTFSREGITTSSSYEKELCSPTPQTIDGDESVSSQMSVWTQE